ncbi:hypothetical protein C8J57DRAFT_1250100 [Mycena rebaudengoi]|nr:hypothetical protein C8J57DRAFT_1250100 [Mycena rebaudengoi]
MPPLPSSELERLFDPLLVQPQLLCNPLWTPVNGLEPRAIPALSHPQNGVSADGCQSSLALIRSYLRYVLVVLITNRVRLPDPVDQAVLVPMLQMLRVVAYTWVRNQQLETEWSPYSAQTGLFCNASVSVDDYFGEVDSAEIGDEFAEFLIVPDSEMAVPERNLD